MTKVGASPLYMAPYSPQTNPIEEFFSWFKGKLRNDFPVTNSRNEIKQRIQFILTEAVVHDCSKYIDYMKIYLEPAKHFIDF